jgi:hypothetical protein
MVIDGNLDVWATLAEAPTSGAVSRTFLIHRTESTLTIDIEDRFVADQRGTSYTVCHTALHGSDLGDLVAAILAIHAGHVAARHEAVR